MKVPGTKLDIPVPDGWTMSWDLKAKEITLSGRGPDLPAYTQRQMTITIPLNDDLGLDWCPKSRWRETRRYQPRRYDPAKKQYVAFGPDKPSTGNVQRRTDNTIFDLARGNV